MLSKSIQATGEWKKGRREWRKGEGGERKEESFYDRDKYSAWKYIGQRGRASQEHQEPLQIRWFRKHSKNFFKQRSEWQEVSNRKIKGESNLIRFLYIQILVKVQLEVTGRWQCFFWSKCAPFCSKDTTFILDLIINTALTWWSAANDTN